MDSFSTLFIDIPNENINKRIHLSWGENEFLFFSGWHLKIAKETISDLFRALNSRFWPTPLSHHVVSCSSGWHTGDRIQYRGHCITYQHIPFFEHFFDCSHDVFQHPVAFNLEGFPSCRPKGAADRKRLSPWEARTRSADDTWMFCEGVGIDVPLWGFLNITKTNICWRLYPQ